MTAVNRAGLQKSKDDSNAARVEVQVAVFGTGISGCVAVCCPRLALQKFPLLAASTLQAWQWRAFLLPCVAKGLSTMH